MWKFHDFPITQILCEINFWDSRSATSTIFTHLEALNFNFYEFLNFLNFLKAEIYQINKFHSPKNGSFRTSRLPKLISHTIWMTDNILKFLHCVFFPQLHYGIFLHFLFHVKSGVNTQLFNSATSLICTLCTLLDGGRRTTEFHSLLEGGGKAVP